MEFFLLIKYAIAPNNGSEIISNIHSTLVFEVKFGFFVKLTTASNMSRIEPKESKVHSIKPKPGISKSIFSFLLIRLMSLTVPHNGCEFVQ